MIGKQFKSIYMLAHLESQHAKHYQTVIENLNGLQKY